MSMDPMWERLGRTRVMARIITAVEDWFERMYERDSERLRTPQEDPPAHDQTEHLVWTNPGTTLYRITTASGQWIRAGSSTPATCVACMNQDGLALTWMSGHEHYARFQCYRCGASWTDPLWANSDATDGVLATAHEFQWDPTNWVPEPSTLNVTQMRYDDKENDQ